MRFHLRQPSPAMGVALTALFVALSGTGYAASQLPAAHVDRAKRKPSVAGELAQDKAYFYTKAQSNGRFLGIRATAVKALSASSATTASHASNADSATSATSAAHATSADSATSAGDAGTLGGKPPSAYLDRCPSGTVLVAGECIESTTRPAASLTNALTNCAVAGRRLATPGELAAYGYAYGMPGGEWADSMYYAVVTTGGSPTFEGMGYQFYQGGGSGIGPVSTGTPVPYRCVTGYTNN